MDGVFRRGKKGLFTARLQVPTQFQSIVGKTEVWQATGTANYDEAVEARIIFKRQKLAEWNAMLVGKEPVSAKSRYRIAAELAVSRGEEYRTADQIASGDIEGILRRFEGLQESGDGPESAAAQVMIGGIEMPTMTLKEVAESMPGLYPEDYDGKTLRGKSVWASRWTRPAGKFIEMLEIDRDFKSIERRQAVAFRDSLKDLVLEGGYKAESAIKEIDNLNNLWSRHFSALGVDTDDVPPSPWRNLSAPLNKLAEGDGQKSEIPPEYIQKILAPGTLAGMNDEERDLVYILIMLGPRQSEITDIPPYSIFVQAEVPYITIKKETGEFARNIKNKASKRDIPLFGLALEAFQRHPEGFPRYRGKGTFSAAANAFLHENDLLPPDVTIGGSRHSFETRMEDANIANKKMAAMMGHSVKRAIGREVYGDALTLEQKLEIYIRLNPVQSMALPSPATALPSPVV